ncbi:MAG: CapA family protein [Ilumatobacteraceae bacterium]
MITGRPSITVGSTTTTTQDPDRHLSFAFTGDVLIHTPLIVQAGRNAIANHSSVRYDFWPMFARVAPLISNADLAICHLETPIVPEGEALSTFPYFGVPSEITRAIADAGFDRCSTASNHAYDRGTDGIDATVNALESRGVTQAGMARTPAEIEPRVSTVNNVRLAHLSYTFSYNGLYLPDNQQWRSATIDSERILHDAATARNMGAEVVIVSMHWGTEKDSHPNTMQTTIANELTASGLIDLIIGHHAHVVQPIVQMNGIWVLFGLGNVLSNLPTDERWPAKSQDAVIATINMTITPAGKVVADRPVVHPTWVDKDHGWVIRSVLDDLNDPSVSPSTKAALKISRQRTAVVVGDYFVK